MSNERADTAVHVSASATTKKIRALNDAFRQKLPITSKLDRLIVTDGVRALPEEDLAKLIIAVRDFTDFDHSNDPHGEHDFGAIQLGSNRFFWKIDAYDRWMQFGSPDPADSNVTTRVLTIMLAEEY